MINRVNPARIVTKQMDVYLTENPVKKTKNNSKGLLRRVKPEQEKNNDTIVSIIRKLQGMREEIKNGRTTDT